MHSPRVALVSGFWGQNIGNAFFNIGGKWILEQVFGEGEVAFIQDNPGYRTFHNQAKGPPGNDDLYIERLDVDYLVLQGPLLTQSFQALWGKTLSKLKARGVKILLVGSAFFKFRQAELDSVKGFLAELRPELITTRDARTYSILKDWGLEVPLYNGIDSAFYVPKAYQPFKLINGVGYVAFNFDRYPEPTIEFGRAKGDKSFEFNGEVWSLKTPRLVSWLAHRSKVQAYLGHVLDRRKLPDRLLGYDVIRPEHRFNPHMTYKIYQHAGAVSSDEPWSFFNYYANSALTLSDRVHACVATLAYGGSAMLFTPSPRAALLERVGAHGIKEEPVSLCMDQLESERRDQLTWIKSVL